MKILFTICGRAGSKGIRNKNIKLFCGKQLSYYTFSVIDLFIKDHPEIEYDVVVNSDSEELLKIAYENKNILLETINRSQDLAGDSIPKIDVIRDSMIKMIDRKKIVYDLIIDLDITSPLRTKSDLENVIQKAKQSLADVVITVVPARRNPFFNQVRRTENGVVRVINSNYAARQQAPEVFDMNASIYAYRPTFLSLGKGVLDGTCDVVEMYDTGILDLDHENDFELMEVIAKYLFKTRPEFGQVYENIL